MTSFVNLSPVFRGLLCTLSFGLMLLLIYMEINLLRKKRHLIQHIGGLILMEVGVLYHLLLSVNIDLIMKGEKTNFIGSAPWIITVLVLIGELVSSLLIIFGDRFSFNRTISSFSVKESIDSIPVGICCYYHNGMTVMVNEYFDSVSKRLLRSGMGNAADFWNRLVEGDFDSDFDILLKGDNPIIRFPEGNIYSFSKYELNIDNDELFEILVYDISETYIKTAVLQEKNEALQKINERLKDYGDTVSMVTRDREILNTKKSFHDKMNQILLTTRYSIEHPNDSNRERVFSMWKDNVLMFKPVDRSVWEDPSLDLMQAADSIGIKLIIEGELPENKEWVHTIMYAAGECMINAVRHANATELKISLTQNEVVFTNNGETPNVNISEGGGLSSIRKMVETLGGRMKIETVPSYRLRLIYEK